MITPPLVAENLVCSNSNFSPTGAITPDHPPPLWPSPPPPLQKILYPRLYRHTDTDTHERPPPHTHTQTHIYPQYYLFQKWPMRTRLYAGLAARARVGPPSPGITEESPAKTPGRQASAAEVAIQLPVPLAAFSE